MRKESAGKTRTLRIAIFQGSRAPINMENVNPQQYSITSRVPVKPKGKYSFIYNGNFVNQDF